MAGSSLFADLAPLIVTLLLIVTFLMPPSDDRCACSAIPADGDENPRLSDVSSGSPPTTIGRVCSAFFVLPCLERIFHTQSLSFVILAQRCHFAMLQSVERGILQGRTSFKILAIRYRGRDVEPFVGQHPVGGAGAFGQRRGDRHQSLFCVHTVGGAFGCDGVAIAENISKEVRPVALAFAAPARCWFSQLGQILINNSDVIQRKTFLGQK